MSTIQAIFAKVVSLNEMRISLKIMRQEKETEVKKERKIQRKRIKLEATFKKSNGPHLNGLNDIKNSEETRSANELNKVVQDMM